MKILRVISYLGPFITTIITFLVLVRFFKSYKINSIKHNFFILTLLSFVDSFLVTILTRLPFKYENIYLKFSEFFLPNFIFIEIVIFSIFYIRLLLGNKALKFKPEIFWLATLILLIIITKNRNQIGQYYWAISLIELIGINIITSIIFYIESRHESFNLNKKEKSILIGIFLFANFSMPYYILTETIEAEISYTTTVLNFFNDIGYTTLYLFVYKSLKDC